MADRISALPNEILLHILSFLPTTDSVASSLLSKRWRHLWRFVTCLHFTDETKSMVDKTRTSHSLNELVTSVLLMRDALQPITRFCFCVMDTSELFDYSNLYKWLTFVTQRRLECLQLHFSDEFEIHSLVSCVFSCRTLVDLRLHGFCMLEIPSVSLPALKTLHLEHGTLYAECLMNLLAGCPILEDLQGSYLLCDADSVDQFLNVSFPRLIRADLHFVPGVVENFDGEEVTFKFPLKVLSNVEFLQIDMTMSQVFRDDIPTFSNLTHMNLVSLNYDGDLFIEVLKNCPKLQVLVLHEWGTTSSLEPDRGNDDQENWSEPEFVPECLLSHLRACTLKNFDGLRLQLQMVRYIMKNAKVLRSMQLWCWRKKVKMIKKNLSSCPRSSTTCRLSVY